MDVIFDFVISLLSSISYNIVLIIIDQLTKERHYILYTTNDNSTMAKVTIYLLLDNV